MMEITKFSCFAVKNIKRKVPFLPTRSVKGWVIGAEERILYGMKVRSVITRLRVYVEYSDDLKQFHPAMVREAKTGARLGKDP